MGKWWILGAMAAAMVCAGCSKELETGYEPTSLNMSLAKRRALYSDPYSAAAQEANQDRADESKARRPTPE